MLRQSLTVLRQSQTVLRQTLTALRQSLTGLRHSAAIGQSSLKSALLPARLTSVELIGLVELRGRPAMANAEPPGRSAGRRPPADFLPAHCHGMPAADSRHRLPLATRRACSTEPGKNSSGGSLTTNHAAHGLISAVFAFLRFSTGWDYMVRLDAVPEKDPDGLRKAPSRWGAAFQRARNTTGVVDKGNAFYLFVVRALERGAAELRLLGTPLVGLQRKRNIDKIEERAGDLVEAVLGAPCLRQHLESGSADTGFEHWTNESASLWAVQLNTKEPDAIAAHRMLAVIAAMEDVIQGVTAGTHEAPTATELCEAVFQDDPLRFLQWSDSHVTPDAAHAIRAGEPSRPATRQRSAAGLAKQAARRQTAKRARGRGRGGRATSELPWSGSPRGGGSSSSVA